MNRTWIRPLAIWVLLSLLLAINILPTDPVDFLLILLMVIAAAFVGAFILEACIRFLFPAKNKVTRK